MKSTLMSVGLLAWLISLVSATALTYRLGANEKACFYAVSPKENTKMAFYFAVCIQCIASPKLTLTFFPRRSNPVALSISTTK